MNEVATRRFDRAVVAAALAVVLMPSIVLLTRSAFTDWQPWRDWALLELLTDDVDSETPLLGPYSRFGWRHPGPLLFYTLWPIYRIAGDSAAALLAGAAIINAGCLVGIVLVAHRRMGAIAAVWASTLLVLSVHALGVSFLWDPWNPLVTVLPLVLVCVLAWSVAVGDDWALPVAVVVGSFAVQSHVGHALVICVVLAVAVALTTWDRFAGRGERSLRALGAPVLAAFALGAALWGPSLFDQVAREGNLGSILSFFGEGRQTAGAATGIRVVFAQLTLAPPWLGGDETLEAFTGAIAPPNWPIPVTLGLLAGLVIVGWRRGSVASRLGVVTLVAIAGAVLAVSRVVGPVLWYLARWTWAIGFLATLSIGVITWDLLGAARQERWRRPIALLLLGATAIAGLAVAVSAATTAEVPEAARSTLLRAVREPTVSHAEEETLVLVTGDGAAVPGTALLLERAGVAVTVEPDPAQAFGRHRELTPGDEPSATLRVVIDDDVVGALADPALELVAVADELTLAERSELASIRASYLAGIEPADLDAARASFLELPTASQQRHDELATRDRRVAVFEVSGS